MPEVKIERIGLSLLLDGVFITYDQFAPLILGIIAVGVGWGN